MDQKTTQRMVIPPSPSFLPPPLPSPLIPLPSHPPLPSPRLSLANTNTPPQDITTSFVGHGMSMAEHVWMKKDCLIGCSPLLTAMSNRTSL